MKIKTAFIFDYCGEPEEEAEFAQKILSDNGFDIQNVLLGNQASDLQQFTGRLDLVLVDFGGLSYGLGGEADKNINMICQWAEDHPGTLIVIWTAFTQMLYENAITFHFGHLDNIVYHYDDSLSEGKFMQKAKEWFG